MDEDPVGVDPYVLRESPPTPAAFQHLREVNEMAPRPRDGVERGLPNSLFAVHVVHRPTEETVGMGRVVGDGAAVFHVTDMAVHPDHQGRGLGRRVMEALLEYIEDAGAEGAYVNLMADVDGFYEQFGFAETRPASKGMFFRVGER